MGIVAITTMYHPYLSNKDKRNNDSGKLSTIQQILYHDTWAVKGCCQRYKSFVTWLTTGCDTLM